jgi:hypothetical protein
LPAATSRPLYASIVRTASGRCRCVASRTGITDTHMLSPAEQKVVMSTIEKVVDRVRGEYLEMPGLQLKAEQVQRLCGVERRICQVVLDTLLDAKFLCVKPDGHYARSSEGREPFRGEW